MQRPVMNKAEMRAPSHSLQRLMTLSDASVETLANAIICVAADDYRRGLKTQNQALIREVEEFFRSEWFVLLSDADPEAILSRLRAESVSRHVGQK